MNFTYYPQIRQILSSTRRLSASIICLLSVSALEAQSLFPSDLFESSFSGGFGDEQEEAFELPKTISVLNTGVITHVPEQSLFIYKGDVQVKGDNGLTIDAETCKLYYKEERAELTGDVVVKQPAKTGEGGKLSPGIELFADKVFLNAKTKVIKLRNNVSIYQAGQIHRGDKAVYNYETRKLGTRGLVSSVGPLIMESDQFRITEKNGKKAYIGENAGLTTHDVANPNFWIRADRTTIYPDDRVVFKNPRLYVGDRAVFWLPYLAQPLDAELGYHFLPGVQTGWGGFLLNRYGVLLGGERNELTGENEDAWLLSEWHADIRTQRGLGLGLDLSDTRVNHGSAFTGFKSYYTYDLDPEFERSSIDRGSVNNNRWKLELKHRQDLASQGKSKTYADFDLTVLSDLFFLEDFENSTFRTNPNPDNKLGIFHRTPNYLAGIQAGLRLNDFYQADTRLPELFFDQVKRPVFNTSILHEGQTILGSYDEFLADFFELELRNEAATLSAGDSRLDEINEALEDRGYNRFHTYHEFSLPINPGGKISIVPKAGLGYTHYSSLDNGLDSFGRTHFSAGLDISTKLSKRYPDLVNEKIGLNGLLHIVQPYLNFSHLTTDDLSDSFNGIQTLIPSTRPRPLEVGRFTAIDGLSDWSITRLGVRNQLLTKRNGASHGWLTVNTYLDAFANDPEFDRSLSNLYNDISWKPLPWLSLGLETQFPIAESSADFREFTGVISVVPTKSFEFELKYRELENHPTIQDTKRIDLTTYTRISELWGFGSYHRLELDDNVLESQQYNIYRNFDSWTLSLGLFAFDNRNSSDEFGLLLNFTLREFPAFNLPVAANANFSNGQ